MSLLDSSAVNALVARKAAESAQRIADADDAAFRAQIAFAAGKFEEYFRSMSDQATKRIQDEYASMEQQIGGG